MEEWGQEEAKKLAQATNFPGGIILRVNPWNIGHTAGQDDDDDDDDDDGGGGDGPRMTLKKRLAEHEGKARCAMSSSWMYTCIHTTSSAV